MRCEHLVWHMVTKISDEPAASILMDYCIVKTE
jgi:hypothetical protein